MARYLITHSLLYSWLYSMRDNPYEDSTTERDPKEEFLTVLRREPTAETEAMLNGREFEDLVTDILHNRSDRSHKWWEAAYTVAKRIKGGRLQLVAKKECTVGDMTFLLYGRLDCLLAGVVTDIKFSKSYTRGKFYDSTQHPMYMELIPEAHRFDYIVSDGSNVWTETYRKEETPDITFIIQQFIADLTANGLLELYKEKWVAA